jgi:DNA adenine methylase/adenine-specific DNA-methyltransferase
VRVLTLEQRLSVYPRLRFMGSKHRLGARLGEIFAELPPGPAVDAFSGSGVVSYVLKAAGRPVVANDHLAFAAAVTEALVANDRERLSEDDVATLCSGNRDGRDFIATTFDGLYFPRTDHEFLDAAWSQIATLARPKRALAIGALCLAAAWKQPRGVFTITTPRYDDGRRQLHTSLQALFTEAAHAFNAAVFHGAHACESRQGDALTVTGEYAIAYLDPPYAPPRDDADYIKRYHFLEGLATYWEGQEIMWETRTRKLAKRHTPFASKRTAKHALERLFEHFRDSTLVVSYGSNAAIDVRELESMLRRHKRSVRTLEIPHRYAFGTHANATRRLIREYVLIAA